MTEKKIAEIFEQVGLAKIVRELKNDELLNAVQGAMIELAKKPELPEGIDEAADKNALIAKPDLWDATDSGTATPLFYMSSLRAAFKSGAEWMAGQGVTKNGFVSAYANGFLRVYTPILDQEDGIKFGDKVVVQIRKK